MLATLPASILGVAITVPLWRINFLDILPAMWLALCGCGALATSFFGPRSIARLGACCLALGLVALIGWPEWPLWTMGLDFGVTHIVYSSCVLVAERRAEREQAFWAAVKQNPGEELS